MRVHSLWRDPSLVRRFRTGVSLHSHTTQSRESLSFIPLYARKAYILSQIVQSQERKYASIYGKPFFFDQAWWTPPLSPREAHGIERDQIENALGLRALVSLSDHDDIEAPMHLHVLSEMSEVPISVEWTVPFRESFFHVGVHNLPARQAHAVMELMSAYTRHPDGSLREILEYLNGFRSVLLVLNHPFWDEPGIGAEAHRNLLQSFCQEFGSYLHAAELNGLRCWEENAAVLEWARDAGLPVISGGDRHGCEPNANVNLTNASTFAEFVDEVRNGRLSTVLFLNQYREPLRLRLMQGVLDVLREYPEFPEGRRRWTDRVFFQNDDGSVTTLSSVWEGDGPPVVRFFMSGVRLLESRRVRRALRMALGDRQALTEHQALRERQEGAT